MKLRGVFMSSYLGVDLGTSNLKILLFSKEDGIIDLESKKIDSYQPKEGIHEQNPEEWVKKTVSLLQKILERNKKYVPQIEAIGFSGQMHGLVCIDSKGNPLFPCMTWVDQRSKNESSYISNVIDIFNITGNLSNPSFTLPKILWLKNNEKEKYKKAFCFFQPKDFLRFKLGKNKLKITDKTDASATLLMNIKTQRWSEDILKSFEIDPQKLPEIKNSHEIVDYLDDEIAKQLGLKKNIPLVAGAGDQEAAAIGLGITNEKESFISCGTAAQIFRTTKELFFDKSLGIHLFSYPFTGWHYLGAIQNAGNVLEWALNILNLDYNEIEKIDRKKDNNLYFLPYLTGERTPIMDENARGVWIGLNTSHTRKDMLKSVLEGISFSIKLAYTQITHISGFEYITYFIGGASKSRMWSQMIADIVERELSVLNIYEGSAYGAALLSAIGTGGIQIQDLTFFKPKIKEKIIPNKAMFSSYNEKYERFIRLINLEKSFRNNYDK
jgi:xylulokinase